MAYNDFDLKKVKTELGITINEQPALFADVTTIAISATLAEILSEAVPLARAINTEKARSEFIIANILMEARKLLKHSISLFSGIEFNVNKEKGLNGFCDFIFSASPAQLLLNAPIIAIVEAKNENIIGGLGQCIAEMVAADMFNNNENHKFKTIYGVVTTGITWKFLMLEDTTASIDIDEYSIDNPQKIIGILLMMLNRNC
jgi:hypothetical protein